MSDPAFGRAVRARPPSHDDHFEPGPAMSMILASAITVGFACVAAALYPADRSDEVR